MQYLIDGYNLIYALGLLTAKQVAAGELQKARTNLLDLIHKGHGEESGDVTVVFDAAHPPAGVASEQRYRGIRVLFARNAEADDMIEELIQQASLPNQCAVISNDRRVQKAGRRRQCRVLSCEEYLDLLERLTKPKVDSSPALSKPEGQTDTEKAYWLREFADIEQLADRQQLDMYRDFFEPINED